MSHIEIFFKIIELVFSFMGLVFVVFGWIIPYRQDLKEEKKRRKFEIELLKCQWEKEFVDRQILSDGTLWEAQTAHCFRQ